MTTRIGSPDNGGTVTVGPGETLELALPENAGSGYQWLLAELPAGLTLLGERRELSGPAAPGAGSLHIFRVRADGSGVLSARLRRPWETGGAVQTFSVRVGTQSEQRI